MDRFLMNSLFLSQAQVAGYTDDDLPEVYLFRSISKDVSGIEKIIMSNYSVYLPFKLFLFQNVMFINQELCARNLAEWVQPAEPEV